MLSEFRFRSKFHILLINITRYSVAKMFRNINRTFFRRIVYSTWISAVSLVLINSDYRLRYALNDPSTPDIITPPAVLPVETSIDDEEWEKKKMECSFCRMFLESPCKAQFKLWSKCVDKAKGDDLDFKEICTDQSKELFHCTADFHDYFEALYKAMDENGNDDDDDDDSENETVEEGASPSSEQPKEMVEESSSAVLEVVSAPVE